MKERKKIKKSNRRDIINYINVKQAKRKEQIFKKEIHPIVFLQYFFKYIFEGFFFTYFYITLSTEIWEFKKKSYYTFIG